MHNDMNTRLTGVPCKRGLQTKVMQTRLAKNYIQKRLVNQKAAKKEIASK